MIKKFLPVFLVLFSLPNFATTLACPDASAVDSPAFCKSFEAAAECNCTSSGLPKMMCRNMHQLYSRMTTMFGSLDRACSYQKQTPKQTCIDDWNCYLKGGVASTGQKCNITGRACGN